MRMKLWSAGITGLVIGVSAAAGQAFFKIQPPVAYAVCMICHPAVMVKWGMNTFFGTDLTISRAFILFPSLLVVGIVIGAFAAADRSREVAWRPAPARKKYMAILFGFLVAVFGLLVGSCPIRIGLLVSYGSVTAVIILVSIVIGVGLAAAYLRLRKESVE